MSVIKKEPCDHCGSQDNLVTHDNGTVYCYTPSCQSNTERQKEFKGVSIESILEDISEMDRKKSLDKFKNKDLIEGTFSAIPVRRISQRTCEFFNYQVGQHKGQAVQIANYKNCQQVRTKDKDFYFIGDTKNIELWGQHKWNPNPNRDIIITEGQIDCMSFGEAQDCKWPVVSLPNGAGSARKSLQANLDWLLGFKSVILCFDNDDAGKKALDSCVDLFPPGKLKIASLSEKDANECLQKGKFDELNKVVWNAAEYRPDGIIKGSEIDIKELFTQEPKGLSLPYPILDEMIRGYKSHRIYTVMAGTGSGKSTFMKEIVYHIRKNHPETIVANIFLEESQKFTALSYIAMDNNLPPYKLLENINLINESQKEKSLKLLSDMYFYRHFGSLEGGRLFNLLEYLVTGKGVNFIILDHVSILISGLDSDWEGERRAIDKIMTALRSFSERTGATILLATQLKRKKGSYSEGETISESDGRGSGSLEHLSDIMISINRDITSDNPLDAQIKVIKNRLTGMVGDADLLYYDTKTGRLLPKKSGISNGGNSDDMY